MITIWINHKTIRRRPIYDPRLFEDASVIFTPNNGMVKNVKICNGKNMLFLFDKYRVSHIKMGKVNWL